MPEVVISAGTADIGEIDITGGTINLVDEITNVAAGTVTEVENIAAGTVSLVDEITNLAAGTVTEVENLAAGTISLVDEITNLAAGTITSVENVVSGTIAEVTSVSNVVSGTIAEVANLNAGTVSLVDEITNVAAGTVTSVENLAAGTITSVANLAAGTITEVSTIAAGTIDEVSTVASVTEVANLASGTISSSKDINHALLGDGKFFTISDHLELDSGGTRIVFLESCGTGLHAFPVVSNEGALLMRFLEGGTTTALAAGTLSNYNRSRDNAGTSSGVWVTGTETAGGTAILTEYINGGVGPKPVGGQDRSENGWVLGTAVETAIEVVDQSAASNHVTIKVNWHEV